MGLLDGVSAFAFDEIPRSIMQESKQWMAINLQHIVDSTPREGADRSQPL